MMRRLRQDLPWALFILGLGVTFGLMQHWHLVQLANKGELPAFLEKWRQQQQHVRFKEVKTVELAQAFQIWEKGGALFLDARKPEEYQEQHIPGAVNLPPEKVEELTDATLGGIAKDRGIIVYCSQGNCDLAMKVAAKLQQLGYTQVKAFLGGFRAWDEAGHPTATGR